MSLVIEGVSIVKSALNVRELTAAPRTPTATAQLSVGLRVPTETTPVAERRSLTFEATVSGKLVHQNTEELADFEATARVQVEADREILRIEDLSDVELDGEVNRAVAFAIHHCNVLLSATVFAGILLRSVQVSEARLHLTSTPPKVT